MGRGSGLVGLCVCVNVCFEAERSVSLCHVPPPPSGLIGLTCDTK